MLAVIDSEIGVISPRLQSLINALKQPNVLRVIPTHQTPGFCIAGLTPSPQLRACVRDFAAAIQLPPNIVEFIATECEDFAGEFKCVYSLKRGWWLVAMDGKTRHDFLDVKGHSIVPYDNLRLIQDRPEVGRKRNVRVLITLIDGIIRKAVGLYSFTTRPKN